MSPRFIFVFGLVAVIAAGALLLAFDNQKYSVIDARQETFNTSVGPIRGATFHGQTFRSDYSGLHKIELFVATYGKKIKTTPVLHLRISPQAKKDIRRIKGVQKLKDNQYYSFSFKPLKFSQDKKLYFFLEFRPKDAKTFTIWQSSRDLYPLGSRYKKGKKVSGDLAFRTYSRTNLVVISKDFGHKIISSKSVSASIIFYVITLLFLWRSLGKVDEEWKIRAKQK